MATNDELTKELEAVKQDLSALRRDIGGLSDAVRTAGGQKGEAAYERVRERGEALRQQGEDVLDRVGHRIDERPTTSVLTAFGTGLLAGMLLNQRRG